MRSHRGGGWGGHHLFTGHGKQRAMAAFGLDPSIMGVRLSDEADSASAVTSLALSNVQLGAPRLTDTLLSSVPNVVRSLFGVIVSAFDSMSGMVGYGSSHFMPLWLK